MHKRFQILFSVLVFSASYIFPQIVISQADYNASQIIGNAFNSYGDTNSVSVNIGQPGGNNNWDFSAFMPDAFFPINYISPAGTPNANLFPNSNVVSYYNQTFSPDDTTTINSETWNYFSLSASNSFEYGYITETTTTTPNTQDVLTMTTFHYPPFDEYDFPLEFNKVWSVSDSTETETSVNGVPGFLSVTSSVINFNIDAWGTMTLPGGNSYPALRIQEQDISTNYFGGFPISTTVTVTYLFITNTGESFSVLADVETPPNSGAIMGTIGWSERSLTDVKEITELRPTKFNLEQNYPNPFNPSTLIQYSIPEQTFVELRIYDGLGKEIKTLVSSNASAGKYQVSWNGTNKNNQPVSSGMYFYSLKTNDFHEVKKMMLIR